MEKEEQDIRFVARFYREGRLDTTRAWERLGIGERKPRRRLLYRWVAVAAVLALVAGFGWWQLYDGREDWVVITSSAEETREVLLPDDTQVTLAEHAVLRYDRRAYGKRNRQVALRGKAYFSVTHQAHQPFRVETHLAAVQVLGTRFQVIASEAQTTTAVASGKVRFYREGSEEVILTPGMAASLDREGKLQVEQQSNPNVFAWKTHVLSYQDAALKEVVKDLEATYKVRLGGLPAEERRLTASFVQTSIEEIVEVINQTLDTDLVIVR